MNKDHDDEVATFREMAGEIRERRAAKEQAAKQTVDKLAEEMFGIRAEAGDGLHTQFPIAAGVLRRALREAYYAGAEATHHIMETALSLKKKP